MFPGEAHLGTGFDLGFRLGHGRQAGFTAGDFLRQAHAVRHRRPIRLLGQIEQRAHFGLELAFELFDMAMGQRAVPRGVGVDPGAVQADRTQAEQAHFLRHLQHLHEQTGQFVKKAAAEAGQRIVIWVGVGGDEAKGQRVMGGALDLAAGKHAGGVAIDQQRQQHRRVVGGAAASGIGLGHDTDIKPLHHFHDEACQMILRQPVLDGRR